MRRRRFLHVFAALLILAHQPAVLADWQAESGSRLQQRAEKAIARVRDQVERSHLYFADAYAYAVWPGVTRIGFGFGGAYGKGVVIEQDKAVGTVGYWQFSSGIQAGLKNFTMIVFFRDKASLESLQRGEMQFAGQAGIDVITMGAHGTPTYNEGVAIIPLTNLGLMAEFAATGVKYNYKPYAR